MRKATKPYEESVLTEKEKELLGECLPVMQVDIGLQTLQQLLDETQRIRATIMEAICNYDPPLAD